MIEASPFPQGVTIDYPLLSEAVDGVNGELSCLVLGALAVDREQSQTAYDVLAKLVKAASGHIPLHGLDPRHVDKVLRGFPERFTCADDKSVKPRYRRYLLTDFGDFAAMLGGSFIDLSLRSSVPNRHVLGNNRGSHEVSEGQFTIPAVQTRIEIIRHFANNDPLEWQPSTSVTESLAPIGTRHHTVSKHLSNMVDHRLLERAHTPRRGLLPMYRPKRQNDWSFIEPAQLIQEYAGIIDRVAQLDPEALDEGYAHLERFLSGAESQLIPHLITRSIVSSGRHR